MMNTFTERKFVSIPIFIYTSVREIENYINDPTVVERKHNVKNRGC